LEYARRRDLSLRSAGGSPAGLSFDKIRKIAGETPALQNTAR
jgi:hypothetical protein